MQDAREAPALLTVAQARRLLGNAIGRDKFYALLRAPGGPPHLRLGRRKIVIPRDALLRWLEEAARRGGDGAGGRA